MVLEGMVPVLMHTPPTTSRPSTTATRLPILEAATAALWPAGPEPIMTRSYFTALMPISLPFCYMDEMQTDDLTHGWRLLRHAGRNSSVNIHAACEWECEPDMLWAVPGFSLGDFLE